MRLYPYSFSPISFYFAQTPRDFVVQEIPLYEWSQNGEHLILQIRKKGISTQEMLKILCSALGCKSKDIGYAGLKDKHALTTQFISLPYQFHSKVLQSQAKLLEQNIKILSFTRHQNKIRIGHLKGNAFFIRLKKVSAQDVQKISNILEKIAIEGIPNYFGFQRFGKFGDNYLEGKKIIQGEKRFKNQELSKFLISSYQSFLFNQWLSQRVKLCKILKEFQGVELSLALKETFRFEMPKKDLDSLLSQKHFFKILSGDALHHYPFGQLFFQKEDLFKESLRFFKRDIVPCGVLCGKKITLPSHWAFDFQKDFLDLEIKEMGSYRFAWIFPQDLQYRYIQEKAHLELSFFLPKGSYATILLEALANQEIKGERDV